MKALSAIILLAVACSGSGQHSLNHMFLCNMLEVGIAKRNLCDEPLYLIRFQQKPAYDTNASFQCGHRTIKVEVSELGLTREDSMSVIFIYNQRWLDEDRLRTHYMTGCGGTRFDGSFDWDISGSELSNWNVVRITQ